MKKGLKIFLVIVSFVLLLFVILYVYLTKSDFIKNRIVDAFNRVNPNLSLAIDSIDFGFTFQSSYIQNISLLDRIIGKELVHIKNFRLTFSTFPFFKKVGIDLIDMDQGAVDINLSKELSLSNLFKVKDEGMEAEGAMNIQTVTGSHFDIGLAYESFLLHLKNTSFRYQNGSVFTLSTDDALLRYKKHNIPIKRVHIVGKKTGEQVVVDATVRSAANSIIAMNTVFHKNELSSVHATISINERVQGYGDIPVTISSSVNGSLEEGKQIKITIEKISLPLFSLEGLTTSIEYHKESSFSLNGTHVSRFTMGKITVTHLDIPDIVLIPSLIHGKMDAKKITLNEIDFGGIYLRNLALSVNLSSDLLSLKGKGWQLKIPPLVSDISPLLAEAEIGSVIIAYELGLFEASHIVITLKDITIKSCDLGSLFPNRFKHIQNMTGTFTMAVTFKKPVSVTIINPALTITNNDGSMTFIASEEELFKFFHEFITNETGN